MKRSKSHKQKASKSSFYIDNKTFYDSIVKWYSQGDSAPMPDNVARAIIQICENLARSGKFAGYTWKDDMIQEAVYICVKSAKNFDPQKTNNPFAYFTQIAFNAFRRFLNIEHTRLATIQNYKQSLDITYEFDDSDEYTNGIIESAQKYDNNYQKSYEIKKKSKKQNCNDIESFFE